jgi:hypothetical protein
MGSHEDLATVGILNLFDGARLKRRDVGDFE